MKEPIRFNQYQHYLAQLKVETITTARQRLRLSRKIGKHISPGSQLSRKNTTQDAIDIQQ